MSYSLDLDEYRESRLTLELVGRANCQARNLCDYCQRAYEESPCKFPERHSKKFEPSSSIGLILKERARQEVLRLAGRFAKTCADRDMPDGEKLTVLIEEVGEVARAILEKSDLANDKHGANLKKELVQVAAVCVAWLESLP